MERGWRSSSDFVNTRRVFGLGFRYWKHAHVRPFFGSDVAVEFLASVEQLGRKNLGPDDAIAVWGQTHADGAARLAEVTGAGLIRVEDGFIRSVGLGADFIPPMSLVLDRRGIYFDPSSESELDVILNETRFSDALLERARAVRERICRERITKYNVDSDEPVNIRSHGRRVILVPGQVEDDASIRKGTSGIQTNLALLQAVRERNPDAFLVYKPHPDVVSRNRRGSLGVSHLKQVCDHIELRSSVIRCIEAADEVHTMTSLSGFDALIRGRRVVTYGMPFYAGWGLTEDFLRVSHRRRQLSLDALVAGALLLYPRYWDPLTGRLVECEVVLDRLIAEKSRRGRSMKVVGLRRLVKKTSAFLSGVTSSSALRVRQFVGV